MLYNFYLKTATETSWTSVENPDGWEGMVSVIRRDKELKGQFITMDVTFTFTSTGFTYLYQKFKEVGYCDEILLKIEQSVDDGDNFVNFYDGIIKISDVDFMARQDNLEDDIIVEQSAKTKVLDNSFFAKIFNNKSLKTNLCAGKSKNNLPITPCTVNYLRMFDPSTGIPVALDQKEGITWLDAFRYLIEFMTDADVEFDSELLSTGEYAGCVLTYGLPIWNQGGGITLSDDVFIAKLPKISFKDLFRETDVKVNLGLYVDNSGNKPKVRIEKWDDLFRNEVSTQISNIDRIITKISVDDIFASLKLGNTETIESLGALTFPEQINYVGFKEEEYIVTGKCNIDSVLDLTGEFVVSSNVIEEILINNPAGSGTPNESYNKKFFLIDAVDTGGGLFVATGTNWIDPTSSERFYNERFTNSNVANNFLKAVPNDIADYLGGALDASFTATQTFDIPSAPTPPANTLSIDLAFNNDTVAPGTDPNNVYNTGTNEFTVPVLGAGQYSFFVLGNHLLEFDAVYPNTGASYPGTIRTQLWLDRYDSFSILQASYKIADVTQHFSFPGTNAHFTYSHPFNIQGSGTINLNDGDIIKPRYSNTVPNFASAIVVGWYKVWEKINSLYQCTGNTTGGGNYQRYNPDDFPIILDSFEQEMTKTVFDKIAAKPLSLIEFSQGAQSYKKGWIDQLRYDHLKGVAQITMLSSRNTN